MPPERRGTPDEEWGPYVRALGRRVADLRERRGWSQLDLANAAGLSSQNIETTELGIQHFRGKNSPPRNPTLHTLYAIAAALQLTPVELLADIPLPVRDLSREQHATLREPRVSRESPPR